jgi:AcrR family transcriptional regulator
MTTRSQQKEATRRAIMDAALRLSAKRGFAGLSLRAVATEAGIAPATFYRHFQSIDDLGLALVDQIGMTLRQLVRDARHRVGETMPRRDVVAQSVETFLEYARSQPNLFRLLLGEGAGNTREFRRAVAKPSQINSTRRSRAQSGGRSHRPCVSWARTRARSWWRTTCARAALPSWRPSPMVCALRAWTWCTRASARPTCSTTLPAA